MHSDELASRRNYRVPSHGRPHSRRPQRRKRGWLLALLSALVVLLIVSFLIARYIIGTSSDQSYVRPNTTFLQVAAGPDAMTSTIIHVQITELSNKGQIIKKATCYADANSRPGFVYERHSVTWLESLLGYHAGIKLLQIDGCAAQLNCLLHPDAVCTTTVNTVDNPQDQIITESLPFGIPETGKGRVIYNIVTTQDGFAVATQN